MISQPYIPAMSLLQHGADADSSLALRRLVVADLAAFFHGARREHSCERNVALLNQKISHCSARSSLSRWFSVTVPAQLAYPFTSIM